MTYRPTIGLEIHAELATLTKMFCSCRNDPDEERPNANVCPICLAHPGTLPAINKEAVRHVLRLGTALGGELADFSEFDRKSYFYPDIPKGYQISQYEHPLVAGGSLLGVAITRIHLEEDTARSIHAHGKSLVDFNRAGIPLMELVTEPVIHDAQTAGNFARELQLLLRTVGASKANLEKGEMRVEANVSMGKGDALGTKVEVKNLNSFRSVERAIAYEVERQGKLLGGAEEVIQETRGWDEAKQRTFSQRVKEGSADYRYFPEPDVPKILTSEVADFNREALDASLPELPSARRERYQKEYALKEADIAYLVATPERTRFFDAVTTTLEHDPQLVKLASNYIVSSEQEYKTLNPPSFGNLIRMAAEGTLSSTSAKAVLEHMLIEAKEPEDIARDKGLLQVSDPEVLKQVVREVLEAHPGVVADYRKGKVAALQYLVGQAMKAGRGAGNPGAIKELLIKQLKK